MSTSTANRKKLDPRAHPCVFLGFSPAAKGYITYDLHTRNITISRNVYFYENHFPQLQSPSSASNIPTISFGLNSPPHDLISITPDPLQHTVNSPNLVPTSHDSIPSAQDSDPANSPQPNFPSLRRSTRIHNPPFYLQDYHHSLTSTSTNHHPGILYPIEQ